MDTILEQKRNLHEERDRIELAIVNEMLSKKTGHKDKLDSEHRQKALLDRYMKASKTLVSLYEKPTSDLTGMSGNQKPPSSAVAFNEFYAAVSKIKDYYCDHASEQVVTMASEFDELEAARQIALGIKPVKNDQHSHEDDDVESNEDENLARQGELLRLTKGLPTTDLVEVVDEPTAPVTVETKAAKLVEFTDEEGYGRYLDLNKCHVAFLQVLKKEETKPNYLTFLDRFDKFTDIRRELKLTNTYKSYVEEMLDYFRDYSRRARPLFEYQHAENESQEQFEEQWKKRTIPGWFDQTQETTESMIDLDSYKSHEELMELGLDILKGELQVRGLKCGGTLEDRARRLWSVRGKSSDQIDDSLRSAPVAGKKGKKKSTIDPHHIASIEAMLSMYAEYFNDHRQATIENVQRKQARTADERNESDDNLSDVDENEDEQDDVVYNPKKLPLGWDGKPIPYWLYKLHGLNLTYTCEICGDATYKGPKTFQRHFAEWRHTQGMKCLDIPNTAHFANITKIEDALSLWSKLKNEKHKDNFQPNIDEEYEDSQGNVVNKKTYEDLARQGLL